MTGLGDAVKAALDQVGVTEERVSRWLRRDCAGCRRRQEKLNQLGWWAARALRGKLKAGKDALEELLAED